MLQTMRSSAKYIWIFVTVAFIGGFLLYESSGLFGSAPITSTTAVATVNGEDILVTTWQQLASQLEQQRSTQTGQQVSLDARRAIEDQAYNQLVDEALLRQEMRRRAITISDDELTNAAKYSPPPQLMQSPELQTNGQFDIAKYQRFLASPTAKQSGLLLQLEGYYRDAIPKQKLYQQVTSGLWISDASLWMNYRDAHDSAQITYATFTPSDAQVATATVSDADVRAYYDAHKKDMARTGHARVTVTEIPRVITAADSASVRNRIIAIRDSVLAGTAKFDDVAKSESADSGSAVRGGDLGKGVKGRFVPAFETAAAALKPGEMSGPVLTQFGYHLIRVDSRNGDTVAMHHILLKIVQSDSNADRTDRKADSLSKMAASAETPDKFNNAVKALGLKTFTTDVTDGEPLMYNGASVPSVSAWAFGAKVGESSDLYDDEHGYYMARLDALTPGGAPSLDAAKNDIRGLLAREKAVKNELDPARKFAIAASASSISNAGRILNTRTATTGMFTRVSGLPSLRSPSRVVGAAFALPVGRVSDPVLTEDAVYVLSVDRRVEADRKAFDATKEELRGQYLRSMQQGRIQEFLGNLRTDAKITDRRKDIQTSLRRSNS